MNINFKSTQERKNIKIVFNQFKNVPMVHGKETKNIFLAINHFLLKTYQNHSKPTSYANSTQG